MKTAELIKLLQTIDKDIPFDAEIVTGDDWNYQEIEKVYHDAPRTFIQFGEPVMGEEASEKQKRKTLIRTVIAMLKRGVKSSDIIIVLEDMEKNI